MHGYNGRRVKRRLFTMLSALSLLLFVAVVVLWVRSHFTSDHLTWSYDDDAQPERSLSVELHYLSMGEHRRTLRLGRRENPGFATVLAVIGGEEERAVYEGEVIGTRAPKARTGEDIR